MYYGWFGYQDVGRHEWSYRCTEECYYVKALSRALGTSLNKRQGD